MVGARLVEDMEIDEDHAGFVGGRIAPDENRVETCGDHVEVYEDYTPSHADPARTN